MKDNIIDLEEFKTKKDLRKINIIYDYETDDTKITLTKDFNALPKIHQLDALQDGLSILRDVYNQKLKELHNGDIEGDGKQKTYK